MARLRPNFQRGTTSDNPLGAAATTISSPGFASLPPAAAPDTLVLVLNPAGPPSGPLAPEPVLVTAHAAGAGSVTVTRPFAGSTARAWPAGTTWECSPIGSDWDWEHLSARPAWLASPSLTASTTDANALSVSGFYRATANTPTGTAAYVTHLNQEAGGTDTACQWAIPVGEDSTWFRRKTAAGTWGPWRLGSRGAEPMGGVIADQLLTATTASVTFSAIPQTYRHLLLMWTARGDGSGSFTELGARLNGDAAANYVGQYAYAGGAGQGVSGTYAQVSYLTSSGAAANLADAGRLELPHYTGTSFHKLLLASGVYSPAQALYEYAGRWPSTAAITSLTLVPQQGNFTVGSRFTLYGLA